MGLDEALAKAREWERNATPTQKAAVRRAQRDSYVVAEAGFGSDADEAEYREAFRAVDKETLARLDAEAAERMRKAREFLGREG